jgi:hypothetical protein
LTAQSALPPVSEPARPINPAPTTAGNAPRTPPVSALW